MFLLSLISYYFMVGIVFGFAFFAKGYIAIAPEAAGASILTRLLWTPASIALWPYLLIKWMSSKNAIRKKFHKK